VQIINGFNKEHDRIRFDMDNFESNDGDVDGKNEEKDLENFDRISAPNNFPIIPSLPSFQYPLPSVLRFGAQNSITDANPRGHRRSLSLAANHTLLTHKYYNDFDDFFSPKRPPNSEQIEKIRENSDDFCVENIITEEADLTPPTIPPPTPNTNTNTSPSSINSTPSTESPNRITPSSAPPTSPTPATPTTPPKPTKLQTPPSPLDKKLQTYFSELQIQQKEVEEFLHTPKLLSRLSRIALHYHNDRYALLQRQKTLYHYYLYRFGLYSAPFWSQFSLFSPLESNHTISPYFPIIDQINSMTNAEGIAIGDAFDRTLYRPMRFSEMKNVIKNQITDVVNKYWVNNTDNDKDDAGGMGRNGEDDGDDGFKGLSVMKKKKVEKNDAKNINLDSLNLNFEAPGPPPRVDPLVHSFHDGFEGSSQNTDNNSNNNSKKNAEKSEEKIEQNTHNPGFFNCFDPMFNVFDDNIDEDDESDDGELMPSLFRDKIDYFGGNNNPQKNQQNNSNNLNNLFNPKNDMNVHSINTPGHFPLFIPQSGNQYQQKYDNYQQYEHSYDAFHHGKE
jgi:hypothetical protein